MSKKTDKRMNDLTDSLSQLMSPLGWHVWWSRALVRGDEPYTIHFNLMPAHTSWLDGQIVKCAYNLSSRDMNYWDHKYWDYLPMQLAHQMIDQYLNRVNKAQHPKAGELDWRPTEVIPEDYYSM